MYIPVSLHPDHPACVTYHYIDYKTGCEHWRNGEERTKTDGLGVPVTVTQRHFPGLLSIYRGDVLFAQLWDKTI